MAGRRLHRASPGDSRALVSRHPTPNVQATTVKIDTHAPSLRVDAPDSGATVAQPVTLSIVATDELSGMDPAPDDKPVSNGGYIEYSSDGAQPIRVRGGTAKLAMSDGRHVVTVTAVDAAGNRTSAQTYTFTQDTTPPQGGMLAVDPSQPRRIAFLVTEECIKSASIQISTDGTTWRPIDTTDRRPSRDAARSRTTSGTPAAPTAYAHRSPTARGISRRSRHGPEVRTTVMGSA